MGTMPRFTTAEKAAEVAGIDAPHFNCGIVLQADRVTRAAPIVRYMLGWSRAQVRDYCAKKGWKISVIAQAERESTA